jgi:uncharacterized protein
MGEFLEDESRIYRSGTWGEMTLHRTVYYVLFFLEELFLNTGWRSLSLFLIGMYFMRRSVFDGSPENDQLIRNLVLWGLGLGVPLQTLAFYLEWYEHSKAWSVATHRVLLDVSTLGIALGYMGLVAMACRRVRWRRRLEPFAAAGRMAFTNYLSQSVIGGLIFYSYGLALFDTLRWPAVFAIALAIYGAQLIVSPIWLRNFQFGPAEWSWRSLTYGKAPPFVRPGPLGNGS